jgi:Pyridoxamine 5'-phosphate oxidase
MPVSWPDSVDEIIGGDLTAALAYVTPAGGVVVTPVAPLGLRDRDAGTVAFTTSLGFGRKLQRIDRDPRVALAFHAREHGFARGPGFVLVQGEASYDAQPDRSTLERLRPASQRFLGAQKTGAFWDRWLSAYYRDRVLVTVRVNRVLFWPDAGCAGEPAVAGTAAPSADPPGQEPPKNGTAPRIAVERAARRIRSLPHALLGYRGADDFPVVAPVSVGAATDAGIAVDGPLPAGGRRAGVLAHSYQPQLIGLEVRQHTGWLQDGVYSPHTASGFRAPSNKTILLLANGFMARRGLKRALAERAG